MINAEMEPEVGSPKRVLVIDKADEEEWRRRKKEEEAAAMTRDVFVGVNDYKEAISQEVNVIHRTPIVVLQH